MPARPLPPGDRLPAPGSASAAASVRADDTDQVRIILVTALGQVPFLPAEKQTAVSVALQRAVALVTGDRDRLMDAVNRALYAAADAVETPGGQSIVALLAHVPKVLGG